MRRVPRKIVLTVLGFVAFLAICLVVVAVCELRQNTGPVHLPPPDEPAELEVVE